MLRTLPLPGTELGFAVARLYRDERCLFGDEGIAGELSDQRAVATGVQAISSGSSSWSSSLPNTRPSNLDAAAASMPGMTCW